MLATILPIVVSAFPVRGMVWKSLDSNLVLDKDTIAVIKEPCTCICPSFNFRVPYKNDSLSAVKPFPGVRMTTSVGSLAHIRGELAGSTVMGMPLCNTTASVTPTEQRIFLYRGKSGTWAVWADSMTILASNGYSFHARWRWSLVDTALPWVRWVDTLRLGTKDSPLDLPVFSSLRPFRPKVLFPESAMAGFSLMLQAGQDPSTALRWGNINGRDSNPEVDIPAGSVFRVAKVASPTSGAIRWLVRDGDGESDLLYTQGKGDVFSSMRSGVFPSLPSTIQSWEPTTGRPMRSSARPSGGAKVLATPRGSEVIANPPR